MCLADKQYVIDVYSFKNHPHCLQRYIEPKHALYSNESFECKIRRTALNFYRIAPHWTQRGTRVYWLRFSFKDIMFFYVQL